MISALTGKPPLPAVAMTGEITLTGRVIPVGGLREKLLAAKRASIRRVIIPSLNLPDLKEIPSYVTRGIEIIPVSSMDEALSALFKKGTFAKTGRSGKARRTVKGSGNAKS
jgi:ATP-dependent Lon protease